MRKTIIPTFLIAFSTLALGQGTVSRTWVAPAPDRTVELKDCGKITLASDGTMVHRDTAGNRVSMGDGQTMQAKDGSTLVMKNNFPGPSKYQDRAAKVPVGF